jgi:hypothetical protein
MVHSNRQQYCLQILDLAQKPQQRQLTNTASPFISFSLIQRTRVHIHNTSFSSQLINVSSKLERNITLE